jgi:hypothetical protein
VLERILDFMTFYFLVCVVMFVYPHSLDAFVNNVDAVRPFFLGGSVLALVLFVILFFNAEQAIRFIIKLARFLPDRLRAKIEKIASTFATGLNISHIRDHIAVVLGLSFLIWAFYALAMYIPFYALGPIAAKGLTFGDAVLLLVVSSIAWILPAPGAMGTYHSFVTVALVKLYGIDATTALSFSLITHEVGYLVVMGIGGWFYWQDRKALAGMSLTKS